MGKFKIVAVDDDVEFLESLRALLESRDYNVCVAHDRNEGLACIRSEQPDLLVLDIMMSSWLDGLDLAKTLKADAEFRRMPIVMLTGIEDRTGLDFRPKPGGPDWCAADAFLNKPIDTDVLIKTIDNLLSSCSARGAERHFAS